MPKNWWFKFEWDDWLGDDELSACTLETQGFWIKCIAMMHRAGVSEFTGSADQLRRKFGILPEELTRCLQDLKTNNAANVRFGNGDVSIASRRLENELKAKEKNKLYVAKHREKDECKDDVRSQSKSKSKNYNKKEEKKTPNGASSATAVNPEFQPSPSDQTRLAAECPTVQLELETRNFIDHYLDNGERGKDWNARWRKWIRNQHKWNLERGNKGPPKPSSDGDMLSPDYKPESKFVLTFEIGAESEPPGMTAERYEELKTQWRERHPDRAEVEIAEYERGSDFRQRFSQDEPGRNIPSSQNGGSNGNGSAKTPLPVPRGQAPIGGT